MSLVVMSALVVALVGVVRSNTRREDGSQRITGPWVLLVALVALALVYLGARYLPADVAELVAVYVAATGGTATATDLLKAARP